MRLKILLGAGAAVTLAAAVALTVGLPAHGTSLRRSESGPAQMANAQGIHKIKHVIVIMQENRSFDSYFGTYPGADGIPKHVCVPDPRNGGCVRPYVDHADSNKGGPHQNPSSIADVNGGKMDGFVGQAERSCADPAARARPT